MNFGLRLNWPIGQPTVWFGAERSRAIGGRIAVGGAKLNRGTLTNYSEIQRATSSILVHVLFEFHRDSPQLILRSYYGGARLPWTHGTRFQRLLLLFLTANVSNKLGNLLFAQRYPLCPENVGCLHSSRTVCRTLRVHSRSAV
jgi:hypothetical protein